MFQIDLFMSPDFRGLIQCHLAHIANQTERGELTKADIDRTAERIENAAYSLIFNRREAARFLGVHVHTFDRWCRREGIPRQYRRINPGRHANGRRLSPVFELADLLEWQQRHMATSNQGFNFRKDVNP